MGAPDGEAELVSLPADDLRELTLRLTAAEAKAIALEQALERRSAEMIALQPLLTETQLRALSRILAGRPVASLEELEHPFSIEAWHERATMMPAEVLETLEQMWKEIEEESVE